MLGVVSVAKSDSVAVTFKFSNLLKKNNHTGEAKSVHDKVQKENVQDVVENSLSEEQAKSVGNCWKPACRAHGKEAAGSSLEELTG